MKLVVISDSHGTNENVIKISHLANKMGVSKIIHLGDDYDDAELLIEEGFEVERVPGVFSSYYTEKDIANRRIIEINGWKILLTHTKEHHENDLPFDIKPEEVINNEKVDIVLYGHTHIPAIEKQGNVYLVNPGHLKEWDKKGYKPSFAILVVDEKTVEISIKELDTEKEILREVIKK